MYRYYVLSHMYRRGGGWWIISEIIDPVGGWWIISEIIDPVGGRRSGGTYRALSIWLFGVVVDLTN
jgi:hypothetical protein